MRRPTFTFNFQIILLSSLANEGNMIFDGWYTDKDYLTALISTKTMNCNPNKYSVTLDVNGGNELVEKEMFIDCDGVYGKLPVPTRTEHTFSGVVRKKDWRKKD